FVREAVDQQLEDLALAHSETKWVTAGGLSWTRFAKRAQARAGDLRGSFRAQAFEHAECNAHLLGVAERKRQCPFVRDLHCFPRRRGAGDIAVELEREGWMQRAFERWHLGAEALEPDEQRAGQAAVGGALRLVERAERDFDRRCNIAAQPCRLRTRGRD